MRAKMAFLQQLPLFRLLFVFLPSSDRANENMLAPQKQNIYCVQKNKNLLRPPEIESGASPCRFKWSLEWQGLILPLNHRRWRCCCALMENRCLTIIILLSIWWGGTRTSPGLSELVVHGHGATHPTSQISSFLYSHVHKVNLFASQGSEVEC